MAAIMGGAAGLDPEQAKLYFATVLPAVAKLEGRTEIKGANEPPAGFCGRFSTSP
jgi:hypothetical protein